MAMMDAVALSEDDVVNGCVLGPHGFWDCWTCGVGLPNCGTNAQFFFLQGRLFLGNLKLVFFWTKMIYCIFNRIRLMRCEVQVFPVCLLIETLLQQVQQKIVTFCKY